MFLMNASPLVALQRKWEPFALSRACRYPVCFSESEDDITRTSVSAKVQMIINNLQSEESSLASNNEYSCLVQKQQKGTKSRNSKPGLQEHIKHVQHGCPADSDGMEVEESSEFGPLVLNSDSDDSVDRDIEEAIQEYLKSKSQCIQTLSGNTESLHSLDGDKKAKEEPPPVAAYNLFQVNIKAQEVSQPPTANYSGREAICLASSPCSASSDDSFEQSIKADIEQFLIKKKEQARKKNVTGGNRRLAQKETQEKPAIRSRKQRTSKAGRNSSKQGGRKLFLRQPPELQTVNVPEKSESDEELDDFKQTSFKSPMVDYSHGLGQSQADEPKQKLWQSRGEQQLKSLDLSDSSSDDGIEEAIQLYQLEKIQKAANSKMGSIPFQKEDLRTSGMANISASLTICSAKSALPEIPRKALSRKRKVNRAKQMELNKTGTLCSKLEKGKCQVPPRDDLAKCPVGSACHADSAAELMCAEAILDISKTILPLPTENDNQAHETNYSFCSQSKPPSHHESDGTTVDSDDGIEQEIRAFLAVKARSEHWLRKSEQVSHVVQNPPSSGQIDSQIKSPKQIVNNKPSFPKTLKLSLSQKRKLKAESNTFRSNQDKKRKLSEMNCSPMASDKTKAFAPQQESGSSRLENNVLAKGLLDTETMASSISFANPLSRGRPLARDSVKSPSRAQQKSGTGDKSSSLDSDEDLDTAIRDLLRSKRKLKKKSKDPKILCKKKVRFGKPEMHIFEEKLGESKEEYKPKSPTLLKSCLIGSRRATGEETVKKGIQDVAKRDPKSPRTTPMGSELKKECPPKSVSGLANQEMAKSSLCPRTAVPLREDTSSVDSDDSIELEIQRFLAEKAKESVSTVEIPKADEIAETLGVAKPRTVPLKAKNQLLEGGNNTFLKQSKKVKELHSSTTELKSLLRAEGEPAGDPSHKGEQTALCPKDSYSQGTGKLQENRACLQAKDAGLSAKRTAVDRDRDQRVFPIRKSKTENSKLQSYFKPVSPLQKKTPHEFKISSKFIAGLRNAQAKKKSVLLDKRQARTSSVLKTQGGLSVGGLLDQRGEATPQRGAPGSASETGVSMADLPHGCTAVRVHERTQLTSLCAEMASLVKEKPLGMQEPPCGADSSRDPPRPESQVDDVTGVEASAGIVCFEASVKEEERKVQEPSRSWEELNIPNNTCSLPLKETVLVHHDSVAEKQSQAVVEGDSAEFIDVPEVEHTLCLAKSKASDFTLRTSIDPGWTVHHYINLSPLQPYDNNSINIHHRKKVQQTGKEIDSTADIEAPEDVSL